MTRTADGPGTIGMPEDALAWSLGGLERVDSCPCCRMIIDDGGPRYSRRDDKGSFNDIWSFSRCFGCGSIYLDPRPDPESLPRAYGEYYTHGAMEPDEAEGGSGMVVRLVNGYLNARFGMQRQPAHKFGALLFRLLRPLGMKLDVYGRHVPRRLCQAETRLLDLGCGNGDFLARARDMGVTATGCDPDEKAVEYCRNRGFDVFHGDAFDERIIPSSYDIVTLNHVIEHVYDPLRLLQRVREMLKPGGVVWIGLPNPAAYGIRVFGSAWHGFHPPLHLILPSQAILKGWLEDSGFIGARTYLRGFQSAGLWRLATEIHGRDGGNSFNVPYSASKLVGDLLSSVVPYWSEETVMIATRPPA